jgi:hypothetical protein
MPDGTIASMSGVADAGAMATAHNTANKLPTLEVVTLCDAADDENSVLMCTSRTPGSS